MTETPGAAMAGISPLRQFLPTPSNGPTRPLTLCRDGVITVEKIEDVVEIAAAMVAEDLADPQNIEVILDRDTWSRICAVLEFVSYGRGHRNHPSYPDAIARFALGKLYDHGLIPAVENR